MGLWAGRGRDVSMTKGSKLKGHVMVAAEPRISKVGINGESNEDLAL